MYVSVQIYLHACLFGKQNNTKKNSKQPAVNIQSGNCREIFVAFKCLIPFVPLLRRIGVKIATLEENLAPQG